MSTRSGLTLWLGYVWMKTWAGLALHPYRSVRGMVLRQNILLPVAVSPTLALGSLFVVGRIGSSLFELEGGQREMAAAFLGITLFGLLLWQGLILVLIYRFWKAK